MAKPGKKNGKGKNGNKRATGVDGKKADEGDTKITHDAGARRTIILGCTTEMKAIIAERVSLNERAGDIRQRLKDAGIDVKSWMVAIKLEEMGRDDRDAYLTNLAEHMSALGIGEQGNLFPDPAVKKARDMDFGDGEDVRPPHLKDKDGLAGESAGTA